jgi:hypothetical protein
MCLNVWGCTGWNYTEENVGSQVDYLGHMIYLGGLGVQKAKVDVIAKVPKPTNLNRLKAFLGWL